MDSVFNPLTIIIWLLFGLIAGYINHNKGNPFAMGCLLGVLLGPIGLLIALISGRNEEELERRGVVVGQTRHCPYCAELVKAEAKVCKHCGKDISKG
ncbi:MAG: zinc ribbon domain-containing protein [Anaerolineae bacterium]|nr:zinc ribbon domain-containing protein [Anaerolineae bacterium]